MCARTVTHQARSLKASGKSGLTMTVELNRAERDLPPKSDRRAPLMATTGCSELSNFSACRRRKEGGVMRKGGVKQQEVSSREQDDEGGRRCRRLLNIHGWSSRVRSQSVARGATPRASLIGRRRTSSCKKSFLGFWQRGGISCSRLDELSEEWRRFRARWRAI